VGAKTEKNSESPSWKVRRGNTPKPRNKFTFKPPSKELVETAVKLTTRRKSLRWSKDLARSNPSVSLGQIILRRRLGRAAEWERGSS
jgi:hypothetical protein